MSIYEYDEEKHIQQERQDAREEGIKKGMKEGMKEGIKKGIEEGEKSGRLHRDVSLVCTKLRKGQNPAQIADALELDVAYIERICEAIRSYAPDYNETRAFEAVQKMGHE